MSPLVIEMVLNQPVVAKHKPGTELRTRGNMDHSHSPCSWHKQSEQIHTSVILGVEACK